MMGFEREFTRGWELFVGSLSPSIPARNWDAFISYASETAQLADGGGRRLS